MIGTTTATTPAGEAGRERTRRPPRGPRVPRNLTPRVRRVTVDGERALAVALSGRFGQGREALISPDDWERISAAAGTAWSVNRAGGGQEYVASGAREAYAASQDRSQRGSEPKTILARLVVEGDTPIDRSHSVAYRNGDRLDVRRSNLEVIPRREVMQYRRTAQPGEIAEGWPA